MTIAAKPASNKRNNEYVNRKHDYFSPPDFNWLSTVEKRAENFSHESFGIPSAIRSLTEVCLLK